MFATAFVCYLDLDSGAVEFASAGHNPALVYRVASRRVEALNASGVALGVFEAAPYQPKSASLNPGDVLVLYTDGITEAINGDEEEFGDARLRALIAEHADLPAAALADRGSKRSPSSPETPPSTTPPWRSSSASRRMREGAFLTLTLSLL